MFNSSLDKLNDVPTRHSILSLEETLKALILKAKTGVEEMRKVWQFRLKRLLDKDAQDWIRVDQQTQTNDLCEISLGKSGNNDLFRDTDIVKISLDSQESRWPNDFSLFHNVSRDNLAKDLMPEFKQASSRKASLPAQGISAKNKVPIEVLKPQLINIGTNATRELSIQKKKIVPKSIQIEVPTARDNFAARRLSVKEGHKLHNREHSESRSAYHKSRDGNSIGMSQVDSSDQTLNAFDHRHHRLVTGPETRLCLRVKDLEKSQLLAELKNELEIELHFLKESSLRFQLFNPYIDFIYEKQSDTLQSNALFKLKRLKLEEKYIEDISNLSPVLQSISSFHSKFDINTNIQIFVLRSWKTIIRLVQRNFSSLRDLNEFCESLSSVSSNEQRIDMLSDLIKRMKDDGDRQRSLFDCFAKRASVKQRMIEDCRKHSEAKGAKVIASVAANDNTRLIEIDAAILKHIEAVKDLSEDVPLYKGLAIEDLIEIDLWEIQAINKLRRPN